MTYAPGTYYRLPDRFNGDWRLVAESRKRWGMDPMHAPLACGPGVVAWGRLIDSNYTTTTTEN